MRPMVMSRMAVLVFHCGVMPVRFDEGSQPEEGSADSDGNAQEDDADDDPTIPHGRGELGPVGCMGGGTHAVASAATSVTSFRSPDQSLRFRSEICSAPWPCVSLASRCVGISSNEGVGGGHARRPLEGPTAPWVIPCHAASSAAGHEIPD